MCSDSADGCITGGACTTGNAHSSGSSSVISLGFFGGVRVNLLLCSQFLSFVFVFVVVCGVFLFFLNLEFDYDLVVTSVFLWEFFFINYCSFPWTYFVYLYVTIYW